MKLDCDGYTYLLYAIALQYNLPLKPVLSNAHIYIVWQIDNDTYLPYETTEFSLKNSVYSHNDILSSDNTLVDTKYKLEIVEFNNIACVFYSVCPVDRKKSTIYIDSVKNIRNRLDFNNKYIEENIYLMQ